MKHIIGRYAVKMVGATFLAIWVTDKVNHLLLQHFGIQTTLTQWIAPSLVFLIMFCMKWLFSKVILPAAMISLSGLIPAVVCVIVGHKYKMPWLTNHALLGTLSLGIPALFILGFVLNKWKDHYSAKSLDEIDALGGDDKKAGGFLFETYVASLYNRLGYHARTVADLKKAGEVKTKGFDQGADVVVDFVENGIKKRAIIQCKLYQDKVSNKAVQEVLAALPIYKADMGIVLTNNFFTEAAIELANANGIFMVDRTQLGKLIEQAKNPKMYAMLNKQVA
jgi:restriction system protein